MTQPEALRLADLLEQIDGQYWQVQDSAAAELRRLHAESEALQNIKHYEAPRGFVLNPDYLVPELRAQRDALLEACKTLVNLPGTEDWIAKLRLAVEQARAAIATVEGEKA